MLIFSTRLIVKKSLTREVFIHMVEQWLSNNEHYHFGTVSYDGGQRFALQVETDSLEIDVCAGALTVRLVSDCDGVIWTNDYVLTQYGGEPVLAIQLYSDAADMSVRMPDRFNKPRLLKMVVQGGYGGMDMDLPVTDAAVMITGDNVELARKLIMHESTYFMPVVYVTYPRYGIEEALDFELLARNLSGIAHVVVESKEIASTVRQQTDEKNPYAGGVDIFYGQNGSFRVIPEHHDSLGRMRAYIEKWVQQKILMTKIEDELSWTRIHFADLQTQNQEAPELLEFYQQMLKETEEADELKKQRIDELELENMELEEQIKDLKALLAQKDSQLQTYQYRFEQSGKAGAVRQVELAVSERELYDGEIRDVILRVLEKERSLMDSDPNLLICRKFHVLEDILKLNAMSGKAEEIADCLKNVIDKSCNMSAQRKRQLTEYGFEIQVGTHYKIIFNKDERYAFTLSKTSSDYRSNTNTLADATNTLFGR